MKCIINDFKKAKLLVILTFLICNFLFLNCSGDNLSEDKQEEYNFVFPNTDLVISDFIISENNHETKYHELLEVIIPFIDALQHPNQNQKNLSQHWENKGNVLSPNNMNIFRYL